MRQRKLTTLESIIGEIKEARDKFGQPNIGVEVIVSTRKYESTVPQTLTPAYESAVNSGNYSLLSADLQIKLSNVYYLINYCNRAGEELLKFHPEFAFSQDVRTIENALREMSNDLRENCSMLVKEIEEILPTLEVARNTH